MIVSFLLKNVCDHGWEINFVKSYSAMLLIIATKSPSSIIEKMSHRNTLWKDVEDLTHLGSINIRTKETLLAKWS